MRVLFALLTTGIFAACCASPQQPVARPEPATLPICGARNLDLGDGVHLTMYMFGGDREFFLIADVPQNGMILGDFVQAATPARITFRGYDTNDRPPFNLVHIGYENVDIRRPDNTSLTTPRIRLDCGNGVVLSGGGLGAYDVAKPRPTSSMNPFFGQDLVKNGCLAAIEQAGKVQLDFTAKDGPPIVSMKAVFPLNEKVVAGRALWMRETQKAKDGKCRIQPEPPAPF